MVCPSTSISALRSILPFAVIAPVNVDTPATLKLSKFVWPSTSKSITVAIPEMLTLSRLVCPSTSNSTKSPFPTNVVAVTTPAIETLSRLVWPSTCKSSVMGGEPGS